MYDADTLRWRNVEQVTYRKLDAATYESTIRLTLCMLLALYDTLVCLIRHKHHFRVGLTLSQQQHLMINLVKSLSLCLRFS